MGLTGPKRYMGLKPVNYHRLLQPTRPLSSLSVLSRSRSHSGLRSTTDADMLQWMGGSRRKVTTSRKSTQKRQKKYFEQRKRREQQHQAPGLGSCIGGMDRYGQRQREHHRSLDILSFLNFSAVPEQHRSGVNHQAIDSEIETHNSHELTTDANIGIWPGELKRGGPALAHKVEAASSGRCINKVGPGAPTDPARRPAEKMDHWEIFPEANMSVLDLLGEDGTDQSPEFKPVNEDHVAFSVDDLLPWSILSSLYMRAFSFGAFTPSKGPSNLDLFEDHTVAFDDYSPRHEMDSSIPDVNIASSLSPSSLSFSQNTWNPLSIPEKETSTFFDSFKHNLEDCGQKLSSTCGKSYSRIDKSNTHVWDDEDVASPTSHALSDDDLFYGKNCRVSSKDSPFRWDSVPGDYTRAHCRNQGLSDPASDNIYLLKKRENFRAKDGLNILGSPERNFPGIDYSCGVMEDANDNLSSKSLGSEESCSSTAVRGKMSSAGLRNSRDKYANVVRRRTDIPQSRDHEGLSVPFNSKRSCASNMHLKSKFSSENDWFLETPPRVDSEFSSFRGTTSKKSAVTGIGLWKAESIGAYPEPDFSVDGQFPFDQPRHYPDPVRSTHSSSFMSATFAASDENSRQFNFHDGSGLHKDEFEPTFTSLHNEINYAASNLSHFAGFCIEVSVKESAGGDVQDESTFQFKQFEGFHFETGACEANDCLSARSGDVTARVGFTDLVKHETSSGAMGSMETAHHPDCSEEETSSSGISTRDFKTADRREYTGDAGNLEAITCTERTEDIEGDRRA